MGNNLGFDAFPGYAGVALSITFSNWGAGYGMGKASVGIAGMGARKPELIIKSLLPVVMASILGIYGMIVSVIILRGIDLNDYGWTKGYKHLAAGACCGFSSMAAGYAIGIVGDIGVRNTARQGRLFLGMLLILIFAEAIGLYGMILAIVVSTK